MNFISDEKERKSNQLQLSSLNESHLASPKPTPNTPGTTSSYMASRLSRYSTVSAASGMSDLSLSEKECSEQVFFERPVIIKKKKVLFNFQVPKNERKKNDQTIWLGEK